MPPIGLDETMVKKNMAANRCGQWHLFYLLAQNPAIPLAEMDVLSLDGMM